MKKVISCLLVVLFAFVLVGCNEPARGNGDGLVYGVTFITNVDGVKIARQTIEKGGKVKKPEEIFKVGYKFVAWECDGVMWNFEMNKVTKSIELVAKWELDPEGWDYTAGLSFSDADSGYQVTSYTGTDRDVKLPVFYMGDAGVKKVTKIGENAFEGNTKIESIDIAGVVEVGNSAFEGALNLTSIDLKNVVKIGSLAFMNTSVTNLQFSDDITLLGSEAFFGCKNLLSVSIRSKNSDFEVGDKAFMESGVKSAVIIAKTIGMYAFYSTPLESITLGKTGTLKSIGNFAFSETNLKNVVIPEGVTHIGACAMKGCTYLETVVVPASIVSISSFFVDKTSNIKGVYFAGDTINFEYFALDWLPYNVMYYFYSASVPSSGGYWKYSSLGVPELHTKNVTLTYDVNGVFGSEVVLTLIYHIGQSTVGYTTVRLNLSNNYTTTVDAFYYQKFNVEIKYMGEIVYSEYNISTPTTNHVFTVEFN